MSSLYTRLFGCSQRTSSPHSTTLVWADSGLHVLRTSSSKQIDGIVKLYLVLISKHKENKIDLNFKVVSKL